jgi:hypothetical protein
MTATIENGQLVIRTPLQTPRPSSSGKTLIVASSNGTKKLALEIAGQEVYVGLNAWIKK